MVVDKSKLCYMCSNVVIENGEVVGCSGRDIIGRLVKGNWGTVIPLEAIDYCQFWR